MIILNELCSGKLDQLILFIHGNSIDAQSFTNQIVDREKWSSCAIDLPGHGKSPKSSSPETDYDIDALVDQIVLYANTRNPKKLVLVGHSLGGHLCIRAAAKLKNLDGLIIFGAPPLSGAHDFPNAFFPHVGMSYAFQAELSAEESIELCKAFLPESSKGFNQVFSAIRDADSVLRPTLGASLTKEHFVDEVSILKKLNIDVAIFQGEHEQLVNAEYINGLGLSNVWRAAIQLIPNSHHFPQLENSKVFNELMMDYINEL